MANEIEHFSESRNIARIVKGFHGGPFFGKGPIPVRTIVEGWPAEVMEKLQAKAIPHPMPLDVWNSRRANGTI